jgi:hypothetical protein
MGVRSGTIERRHYGDASQSGKSRNCLPHALGGQGDLSRREIGVARQREFGYIRRVQSDDASRVGPQQISSQTSEGDDHEEDGFDDGAAGCGDDCGLQGRAEEDDPAASHSPGGADDQSKHWAEHVAEQREYDAGDARQRNGSRQHPVAARDAGHAADDRRNHRSGDASERNRPPADDQLAEHAAD